MGCCENSAVLRKLSNLQNQINGLIASTTQMAVHEYYEALYEAEDDNIVASVAITNGALTIVDEPDVPRKLVVTITDANSSITAGTLEIVGSDNTGSPVTQSIPLTGGTKIVTTNKAFCGLFGDVASFSLTVVGVAGATGADTIKVGVSAEIGLTLPVGFTDVAIYHMLSTGSSPPELESLDQSAGTFKLVETIPGDTNYHVWFTYKI